MRRMARDADRSDYGGGSRPKCATTSPAHRCMPPFLRLRPLPVEQHPYSVNMWARPRSSASSSRAIMCSVLGRRLPFAQRKTVWR